MASKVVTYVSVTHLSSLQYSDNYPPLLDSDMPHSLESNVDTQHD